MTRDALALCVAACLVVTGCRGDEAAPDTTAPPPATASSIAPPTPPPTTIVDTTTSPTTGVATTTTMAAPSTSSTSSTTVPAGCDRQVAATILDDTVDLARLTPGSAWFDAEGGVAFDARTDTAAEFGRLLAYDCSLRLAQRTDAGAERLALIAWNDLRHALVLQATDGPSEPYDRSIRFQLLLEQPLGEWLVDQFVWAATLSGGESIVIGTRDASAALTAKSWQSEIPPFEDLPVTLESESYGIDALRAAGARNVSVAEPAPYGSLIGSIQLQTPLALSAFAAVAPDDAFDPMVPIVADGDTTFHDVGGVAVRLTSGKELGMFDLVETGWSCDGHSWRLFSGYGTPAEVLDFTTTLVTSTCA